MKTIFQLLFSALALLVTTNLSNGAQYFRMVGSNAVTIVAFQPDGTIIWNNARVGGAYTVQTTKSIPAGTNWVPYVQIPATNAVQTNLIVSFDPPAGMTLIPAGLFTMGDTLDGEYDASPTNVIVSGCYMDLNLVSYGQWQLVYNWAITNGYSFVDAGTGKGTNYPLTTVDWFDAVKWSNARSQQAGLAPVYYTDTNLTQVFTNGELTNVYANWSAGGFRLPTEAEWEKAARGGLINQRFPWGDTIRLTNANYVGDTTAYTYDLGPSGYNPGVTNGGMPYTSPQGFFAPNNYGLYDMAGNVNEWCWDWYGAPYEGGTDPEGPATGDYRVVRGGFWDNYAYNCRCADRDADLPDDNASDIGFRCVCGL